MKNSIKLQALALLIACQAPLTATATVVSFGFSGAIDYISNPSNAVPAGIVYGTPFNGTLTYDTAAIVNGEDFSSSTNMGFYYFDTNGGFSISATLGGHAFSNIKHVAQVPYGDIIVQNDFFGQDSFEADESSPHLLMDGGPLAGNPDASSLILELEDASATAYNNDALPQVPPQLANFAGRRHFEIITSKNGSLLYVISGEVTNITGTTAAPLLSIQLQPNKTVRLSWPLAAQGFGLQQNTNLVAGIGWQTNSAAIVNTPTEHTITVSAPGSQCFFRLVSP